MPVTYKFLSEIRLMLMTAEGEVSADDILAAGAAFVADPKWQNGYRVLCDYRPITRLEADTAGVEKIVAQDRRNDPLSSESMCAIVAQADYVYGMARMWEMLADDTSVQKRVCRTLDEAMDWLGLDDEERKVLTGELGEA